MNSGLGAMVLGLLCVFWHHGCLIKKGKIPVSCKILKEFTKKDIFHN